jgi:hypothetical protein
MGRPEHAMRTLFSLSILITLASPIYAVDGVVLINQSIALAGGVTPGDAPGFPVTISVSGSYRLSGNLTVPDANTNAIVVTADNVTIDLNGFSILGPVVCDYFQPGFTGPFVTTCSPASAFNVGIQGAGAGLSVSNGTVRGMGTGILSGISSRITNVQAVSNFIGISASSIGEIVSLCTACTASTNGGIGILVGGQVSGSVALHNGGAGISLLSNGSAINNLALENAGDGIDGAGTFVGNTSSQNVGAGISASCPSLVATNAATQNSGGNIITSSSSCVNINDSSQ